LEYKLRINEAMVPVKVEPKENRQFRLSVDDKAYDVTCDVISEDQLHLVIDGEQHNAFLVEENEYCRIITINGIPYKVEDADQAGRRPARRRKPGAIPREVTPPMPSVVVKLLVAEGDTVRKGDGVVVVSAMKMETTLAAPFDGRVGRINVAEGEKVKPGQILVDIQKGSIS